MSDSAANSNSPLVRALVNQQPQTSCSAAYFAAGPICRLDKPCCIYGSAGPGPSGHRWQNGAHHFAVQQDPVPPNPYGLNGKGHRGLFSNDRTGSPKVLLISPVTWMVGYSSLIALISWAKLSRNCFRLTMPSHRGRYEYDRGDPILSGFFLTIVRGDRNLGFNIIGDPCYRR